MMKKRIIKEINSLKSLSVLGIVLVHYPAYFKARPFAFFLIPFYSCGHYFVDFMLMISGFVMAKSYLGSTRSKNLLKNIAKRFLRFYPVYLVTLLIVAILQYFFQLPESFTRYNNKLYFLLNLFLINFVGAFNCPSWFLSVLFLASVLFFLIIFFIPKHYYLIFLLIVIFSSLSLLIFSGRIVSGLYILRTFTGFFLGTLIFYLSEIIKKKQVKIKNKFYEQVFFISSSFILTMFWTQTVKTSLVVELITIFIAFPSLVISSYKSEAGSLLLNTRPLLFLARISFSMFLFHYPLHLVWFVLKNTGTVFIRFNSGLFFIFYFLSLFIISDLSSKYLELPCAKFIRKRIFLYQA